MTSFTYSDGDSPEDTIIKLLGKSNNLSSSFHIAPQEYSEWATRYHLCSERGNLLRAFNWEGLEVLELGAGMGGVSRVLAESCKHLTLVEGSERRLTAAKLRLRDLKNWDDQCCNIADFETDKKFDVVCLIGVLEYSRIYVEHDVTKFKTPFHRVLLRAKELLKPEGVVVVAIENKLGLKYFSGCPEDHVGKNFEGLVGYSKNRKTAYTFSKKELETVLHESGFDSIKRFFPFPDYKIPNALLSENFIQKYGSVAAELASTNSPKSYVDPRLNLFPDFMVAKTLAEEGLLGEFSNSFLFFGSSGDSKILDRVTSTFNSNTLAKYYTSRQGDLIETDFVLTQKATLETRKRIVSTIQSTEIASGEFNHRNIESESVHTGTLLKHDLIRSLYLDGYDAFYSDFVKFLKWAVEKHGSDKNPNSLNGLCLDGTISNCILDKNNQYKLFDLEWSQVSPIKLSYFIYRNIKSFSGHLEWLTGNARLVSLEQLYEKICVDLGQQPSLEEDFMQELKFQKFAAKSPDLIGEKFIENEKRLFKTALDNVSFETLIKSPTKMRRALENHLENEHYKTHYFALKAKFEREINLPLSLIAAKKLERRFPSFGIFLRKVARMFGRPVAELA
jgi:2-polyprenyl-3-methyl-5-hydroxy-6-metoxy-1,4-benzoquinol methylase